MLGGMTPGDVKLARCELLAAPAFEILQAGGVTPGATPGATPNPLAQTPGLRANATAGLTPLLACKSEVTHSSFRCIGRS